MGAAAGFSWMKHEGGDEALRFFTEPKNVCVRYPEKS